ncbi:MAG TPA: CoA transferase [Chondromyces sp.]|nr:CoA transferase [Chondromyces sp.]
MTMLSGLKVFDFTQYLPGPYATLRLADLGADVIKIERPGGDPARSLSGGKVFEANNRGKKSIVVDLKDREEQRNLVQLLQEADVIIESFRPGVMASLGLGYEQLANQNPGLIYCSLSGYGQAGTLSKLGSHDINYMALSGVLSQLKDQNGRPVHPSITFADLIGGMAASEAILAAAFKRERSGEGSYIDLAMTDVVMSLLTNHVLYEGGRGVPSLTGDIVSYHLYETKDGRFMSMGALELKFWQNFCFALERPDWVEHHFSPVREDNPVYKEVCAKFRSKTFAEWIEFSEKIDCCMAPVLEIEESIHSTYNKERQRIFSAPWKTLQVKTAPQSVALTEPPELNEHHEKTYLSTNKK